MIKRVVNAVFGLGDVSKSHVSYSLIFGCKRYQNMHVFGKLD